MTRNGLAAVASLVLLLGAANPARAERFVGLKYLGGLEDIRPKQQGALVLEGGALRFEDRKGRVVFALPLAGARASIGAEKRTTLGSILKSTSLMMVAIPLSAGMTDPTSVCSRSTTPLLVVRLGEAAGGATLSWRGPKAALDAIAAAINAAASQGSDEP